MLSVDIGGIGQLRQLAAQIKATGDKGLGRELGAALTKAAAPITTAITAEAGETAPSGYAETLTRSLKHRRTTRTATRQASIRITTTAKGQQEERDIVAFNRGALRHPVFGRRKKPWTVTKVEAGFHERGTRAAAGEAEKQLTAVLDDFADRLTKG